MEGFWSSNDYFAFNNTYRYDDENVSLDHFTIVEEKGIWNVYNWMQYFTPVSIEAELNECGFNVIDILSGFDVDAVDETSFGVVAKPIK